MCKHIANTSVFEKALSEMAVYFPYPNFFDHKRLIITEEGKYSITKPKEASKITSHILEMAHELSIDTSSIVDATACIGGDTLAFLDRFNTVTAVELSKENFEALKVNMKVFGFEPSMEIPYRLRLLQDDYVKCLERFESQIIYMDPPWGGPDYYLEESLDLYLSDVDLKNLVPDIFAKTKTQLLGIKVPYNFALQPFRRALRNNNLQVRKFDISRSIHLLLVFRASDTVAEPSQKRKSERLPFMESKKSKHPPIVWQSP